MFMNAVFVIQPIVCEKLLSMKMDKRMDFILGIDGNTCFENNLVDMEFINIYSNILCRFLLNDVHVSKFHIKQIQNIYNDEMYSVFLLRNQKQFNEIYEIFNQLDSQFIKNQDIAYKLLKMQKLIHKAHDSNSDILIIMQ